MRYDTVFSQLLTLIFQITKMPNPFFRFKQFTVYHDQCAMKVGTDGVLLGSWADTSNCNSILDIGSGSGLISLMLAQRSNARIDAVEIDREAFLQSLENINASPWKERIHINPTSFLEFYKNETKKYDLIVSNPPYFSNSLLPPNAGRQTARHSDGGLTLKTLVQGASVLLNDTGKMAFILPFDQINQLEEEARNNNLFFTKKTAVKTTPLSYPKRMLVELAKHPVNLYEHEIIIETERHIYSEEFNRLTGDFYLDK